MNKKHDDHENESILENKDKRLRRANQSSETDDELQFYQQYEATPRDICFSFKLPWFNKTINISYCDTFKIVAGNFR